jgi:hypothetical protein
MTITLTNSQIKQVNGLSNQVVIKYPRVAIKNDPTNVNLTTSQVDNTLD